MFFQSNVKSFDPTVNWILIINWNVIEELEKDNFTPYKLWLIIELQQLRGSKGIYKVFNLVFSSSFPVIDSLSNLSVRIPEYIQKGQTADLTCSFNLGGDKLYSVKWYKGRHEFYRYMPGQDPIIKTFPVKGMEINVSLS